MFAKPIGYLLRGICFDSSAFSKESFYPTVFVQPLYRDVDYIFFTFGGRLRGSSGEGWDLTPGNEEAIFQDLAEAIRKQALPFLETLREPVDLALANENYPESAPKRFRWPADDINVMEEISYSWLLARDSHKAISYLDKIRRSQESDPDDRPWVLSLLKRVETFQELLRYGKEAEALRILDQWRAKSAAALELTQFLETQSSESSP